MKLLKNSLNLFIMLCCIVCFLSAIANSQEIERPEQIWNIEANKYSIYIGEIWFLNITGKNNTYYEIEYTSPRLNITHTDFGRTDNNGTDYIEMDIFQEDEKGIWRVELIFNSTIRDYCIIDVIWDKNRAQDLYDFMQDDQIRDLQNHDRRQDNVIDEQFLWMKNWLVFFFIPSFCIMVFGFMLIFYIFWPPIKVFYDIKRPEEKSTWISTILNLFTAGKHVEWFDEEHSGFTHDVREDKPMEAEAYINDSYVDHIGKTQEEHEVYLRNKEYGDNSEEEYPYGKVNKTLLDQVNEHYDSSDSLFKTGIMFLSPCILLSFLVFLISGIFYSAISISIPIVIFIIYSLKWRNKDG